MISPKQFPQDQGFDQSLALIQEGYRFIRNRVERLESNIFEAHFFGKKVICMNGAEAAKLFYDPEKFQRKGATPKRIEKSFLGVNSIQAMDGQPHLERKQLLMSLMSTSQAKQMGDMVAEQWETLIPYWEEQSKMVLFDEAKLLLCRVACKWTGVPIHEDQVREKSDDFIHMVDSFGAIGTRHWKGRFARRKTEEWITSLVRDVRNGHLKVDEQSAIYQISFLKYKNGDILSDQIAGKDLITIMKSVVAVSIFITFAALALHEHPQMIPLLKSNNQLFLENFAQEVRRYYPFAPFISAKVKNDFEWKNYHFKEGMLVVLDLYGTNHDPNLWVNPDKFEPERFMHCHENFYKFIPQGAGDPAKGHRCSGEEITVEIIKATIEFLVNRISFHVPKQDLSYKLSRLPSLPKSGFIISNVKGKTISN